MDEIGKRPGSECVTSKYVIIENSKYQHSRDF